MSELKPKIKPHNPLFSGRREPAGVDMEVDAVADGGGTGRWADSSPPREGRDRADSSAPWEAGGRASTSRNPGPIPVDALFPRAEASPPGRGHDQGSAGAALAVCQPCPWTGSLINSSFDNITACKCGDRVLCCLGPG